MTAYRICCVNRRQGVPCCMQRVLFEVVFFNIVHAFHAQDDEGDWMLLHDGACWSDFITSVHRVLITN